jgi:hypothetical protein
VRQYQGGGYDPRRASVAAAGIAEGAATPDSVSRRHLDRNASDIDAISFSSGCNAASASMPIVQPGSRAIAGQRVDLDAARIFEPVHGVEGLRDRSPARKPNPVSVASSCRDSSPTDRHHQNVAKPHRQRGGRDLVLRAIDDAYSLNETAIRCELDAACQVPDDHNSNAEIAALPENARSSHQYRQAKAPLAQVSRQM